MPCTRVAISADLVSLCPGDLQLGSGGMTLGAVATLEASGWLDIRRTSVGFHHLIGDIAVVVDRDSSMFSMWSGCWGRVGGVLSPQQNGHFIYYLFHLIFILSLSWQSGLRVVNNIDKKHK